MTEHGEWSSVREVRRKKGKQNAITSTYFLSLSLPLSHTHTHTLSFLHTFPLIAVSRFHSLPLDRRASRINVSEIQLRVPWQLSESSRIQLMLTMRASLFPPLLPRIRLKHRTESIVETSAITCEGKGEKRYLIEWSGMMSTSESWSVSIYALVNVTSGPHTQESNREWEGKSGRDRGKNAEKNTSHYFLRDFLETPWKKRVFQFVGAFTVSFTTLPGKHIVSSSKYDTRSVNKIVKAMDDPTDIQMFCSR